MTWLARVRSFLRAALSRRRFEREMDGELRFHLEARAAHLERGGLDAAAARRQARRELGDPLRWKEAGREARGLSWLDEVGTDLRYGLRWLRRRPAFAIAAVSTLALATAANTTMFAMVDAVLLRPLPFANADHLVYVASVRGDNPAAPFTLPEFLDYRAAARGLSGLAAYANWSASFSSDDATDRLQGARVSANLFEVLGASASAGRLLADADDQPDAPRVVVISHRLWQQRFGASGDVIGRPIRINGETAVVVGVLPRQFPLPLRDIDVVVPLVPGVDPVRQARGSTNFLRFIGRLGPGVTAAQATAELTAVCARLRSQFPVEYARKLGVSATPLADVIGGDLRPMLLALLLSVAVVLTAALSNLLGLVLVRTNGRRSEMSVRVALGASRSRLVRQLAVEALLVAGGASVIGLGLSALAISSAPVWAPASVPRVGEIQLGLPELACAAGLAVIAALLLTVAPLGLVGRMRVQDALKSMGRGGTGDRRHHRLRDGLVAAEIALALVLLVAASQLVHEFGRLQHVDPGFEADRAIEARVSLPSTYRTPADLARFGDRLMDAIMAIPGVRDAGLISVAPMSGLLAAVPFDATGESAGGDFTKLPLTNFRVITPGYLAAAGTRIVRGRGFTDRDRAGATAVALVSEALAQQWLRGDALGHRIQIFDNNTGPVWVEVVGVVENVREASMSGPPVADLYIPLAQIHPDIVGLLRNSQFWMVRGELTPELFATSVTQAVRAVDRDAAVSGIGPMRQNIQAWLAPRRFSLTMVSGFALTAVLLAVSGLYGLVAYAVSQRRREIGLRMALGASAADIRRMVLGSAARLTATGIAAGIALTLSARPLKAWLIGDAPVDLTLAVLSAVVLFVIVIGAGALPARRASRIAPTVALGE